MVRVKDVYRAVDRLAPFRIQEDYDNSGFLVGREEREVTGILVALDITAEVVVEAAQLGVSLILSHHPVIFHPARSVTDRDETGRILLSLIEGGISAICAHTNLDAAQAGVNDCLARALGLEEIELLCQNGVDDRGQPYGIGRVGRPHSGGLSPLQYAAFVKKALETASVRFVDTGRAVSKVAVGGGACASMLQQAVEAGCDTFVTADVKYDVFLHARALGCNLMDAGHFPTEQVVCHPLARRLEEEFPGVRVSVSRCHREVYSALEGDAQRGHGVVDSELTYCERMDVL